MTKQEIAAILQGAIDELLQAKLALSTGGANGWVWEFPMFLNRARRALASLPTVDVPNIT